MTTFLEYLALCVIIGVACGLIYLAITGPEGAGWGWK